ncbi:proton/sodium-translocating pyrophosphatase [Telmatocola sphagniphila]|nr:sodium/proton-translocating pyrophosphatase [Telmatocola sphagniphila]
MRRFRSLPLYHLAFLCVILLLMGAAPETTQSSGETNSSWQPFSFLTDSVHFGLFDKLGLLFVFIVSILSLVYAFVLSKQVFAADQGTLQMQEIAKAVSDGSKAYLQRQFRVVFSLVFVLTGVLILAKWPFVPVAGEPIEEQRFIAISRGIAFFVGATFSAMVGFFGMKLATTGNLRVAQAARKGFSPAMKLGYQTGTVTGMMTTGLGLLGGSVIVLVVGEKAYQTLLGFAFGGSLLALFMRVGGGIYTKAADVGADLVGKIEANIPEDDPRNAATIADNVGDNVGDCAGMAADVFESYTVTMVAAMILGYAAIGPKAMLLPMLLLAIGVLASMISTSIVGKKEPSKGSTGAMQAINMSFRLGAVLSVIGFVAVGSAFLRFDEQYVIGQALERGIALQEGVKPKLQISLSDPNAKLPLSNEAMKDGHHLNQIWSSLSPVEQENLAQANVLYDDPSKNKGDKDLQKSGSLLEAARALVPVKIGWDMRPIWAALIGIVLTLALMRCTEYWTSTDYSPVGSIVKSSRTGHATNIIQGIAVGYESTVWAVILIASAIYAAVFIYQDTHSPIFIAFGVSLCGIGMLALTGDTLSMDVFGPVSDNANGIGEMGFNRDSQNKPLTPTDPDYIPEAEYIKARQILTDLDATGNTTKAITKGIAIGSAVIAAVSLFASFIAVLVKGSEEAINELTTADFMAKQGRLSVASPEVFIGMLIGGCVPFLFSSMTIRAVGRAAYLIVNECRRQFKDQEIWSGHKRPDYGRVVDICTGTAQRELIGPGLLAICTPLFVGFLLGPFALGGFLAGMIVVGQLLGVFMTTSGGAWDNAKKMIEDQPRTDISGKGSELHKASVTGDTVGDPLKDTAGPAINPLIKVMNMVSLLILPLVMLYNVKDGTSKDVATGWIVIGVALLAISWAWWQSKRDTEEMREMDADHERELASKLTSAK